MLTFFTVNHIFLNKLKWNLNQISIILIQENVAQNVICKLSAIFFFRPQYGSPYWENHISKGNPNVPGLSDQLYQLIFEDSTVKRRFFMIWVNCHPYMSFTKKYYMYPPGPCKWEPNIEWRRTFLLNISQNIWGFMYNMMPTFSSNQKPQLPKLASFYIWHYKAAANFCPEYVIICCWVMCWNGWIDRRHKTFKFLSSHQKYFLCKYKIFTDLNSVACLASSCFSWIITGLLLKI